MLTNVASMRGVIRAVGRREAEANMRLQQRLPFRQQGKTLGSEGRYLHAATPSRPMRWQYTSASTAGSESAVPARPCPPRASTLCPICRSGEDPLDRMMSLQCNTPAMTPPRRVAAYRLDEDLIEGLEKVWAQDGVQPSEQVRRAVRQWLEARGVIAKPKAPPRRGRTRREG